MQVFLSYRRGESGGHTGRLHDALARRLGSKAVFHDVSDIRPGEDFTAVIDRALGRSDVVLAIIGPTWLTMTGTDTVPRLHEPGDYVRLELTRALELSRPVVPVLVGGASLPSAADLPPELEALPRRQAVVLRDETWQQDVDRLVRLLRGKALEPQRRGRLPAAAAAALLAVAAIGAAAWWTSRGGSSEDAAAAEPPECTTVDAAWTDLALAADPSVQIEEDEGPLVFTVTGAQARQLRPDAWMVLLQTDFTNAADVGLTHGYWYYELLVVGGRPFDGPRCMSPQPAVVPPGTTGQGLVGFEVTCEPTGHIELRISYTDASGDRERRLAVTADPTSGEC